MPWFLTVKVFKIFLNFFLEIFLPLLSFFKGFAVLPIYGVRIFFFLRLKVAVSPRVLLLSSAEIIVQAAGHTN
jgi:hypothetical protein